MQKIKSLHILVLSFIRVHKIWSVIIFIAFVGGGYMIFHTNTKAETRYITTNATVATVVTSVSGSGQVLASNQIDVKAKASGQILYIAVKSGQTVKAGTLIASLDSTDAQKAVRDAELSLKSADLSLQKLKQPADSLSLLQAQNALTQANVDLQSAYGNGFDSVSNAFLDLPAIMIGLNNTLTGHDFNASSNQTNISYYADNATQYEHNSGKALVFRDDVNNKFNAAQIAYNAAFLDYKTLSPTSDTATIENVINETYTTAQLISSALKSTIDFIQYYQDTLTSQNIIYSTKSTTALTTLSGYSSKLSSDISSLSSIRDTIRNTKLNIPEKQQSLTKLQQGADVLDIQSSELSLEQRQNAVLDAKQNLDNYSIRAPFDGTIAKLSLKKGDSISSGTAAATLITTEQMAQISLNEVDVAKIKVGEKATITFDAIDGLSIAGQVADIDSIGTVSQGVVSYTVQLAFATQDDRIKSGMSVSAAIITNVAQDVLTVPNSAVKTKNGSSYVEMFATPLPQALDMTGTVSTVPPVQHPVEIGLSNDLVTQITSGLSEEDQVVSRTITPTTTTSSSAPSLLGGSTNRNSGTGALRGATTGR